MSAPDVMDWEEEIDVAAEESETVEIDPLPVATTEQQQPQQAPQQEQRPRGDVTAQANRPVLYLDFETAPDAERMELFGLPPLPEIAAMMSLAECPDPTQALVGSLDDIEKRLTEWNPDDSYLELVVATEAKAAKPRSGVAKICSSIRSGRAAALNAESDRRKLLSVTPEYCRIVAVGFAFGNGPIGSYLTEKSELPGGVGNCWSGMPEKELVESIWDKIRVCSQVIGFNILQFDLQVLKVRSVILGVDPSRWLNDSPFNNRDVCDLMLARFGKGGRPMKLKQLARLYGVPVPAGDTDGGDVERMISEDPAAIHRYVQSDIEITRALHRLWAGVFCV